MKIIERQLVKNLLRRLEQGPHLLQIVVGPRQVGKTVAVKQVLEKWQGPSHYASADIPVPPDAHWIQAQWQIARHASTSNRKNTLLVLDEVQKIARWSEVVKALYDEDRSKGHSVRVVLLGSAALRFQKDAKESLAGRFERHYCSHWSWTECRDAFGWDLGTWLYFGGYPGAAPLIESRDQWAAFVRDSLIDSVLSKDVLQLTTIAKPALLRQLFMLAVQTPAQILSYNKMLGQLQDAGNTVTLAHYLNLLSSAYLVSGLQKWSPGAGRSKASSPKLVVWNNALVSAVLPFGFEELRGRGDLWGRLVENAVGAALLNQISSVDELYYWRHDDQEVDFIVQQPGRLTFIEVQTAAKRNQRGLDYLKKRHPKAKTLVIGPGGVPLENFFLSPATDWI